GAMLYHRTPVLHHVDPGIGEPLRRFVVAYPELEPHGAGLLRDDVVDMRRDVTGAAEDDDDIDVARHVLDGAMHWLTENLRHVRVVDRHRHDVVADALEVGGDVVCRGGCVRLWL